MRKLITTSSCKESRLDSFYSLSWPFMCFTIFSYFINLLTNFPSISPSGMKVSREDSTWLCHLIPVSLLPHGEPAAEYAVIKSSKSKNGSFCISFSFPSSRITPFWTQWLSQLFKQPPSNIEPQEESVMSPFLEGTSSMRRRACMLSSCPEHSWFFVNILELDVREMSDTEKHRDAAARCQGNWRKNLDGGGGDREKQLWGTEGETLSISFPKGKKRKRKQDTGVERIPISGQEGVPRMPTGCLTPDGTWNAHAFSAVPSLIFHHSCLREGTIKQPLKVFPCGYQLISSSVLLLLLRQNMTLWSLPQFLCLPFVCGKTLAKD